MKLYQMISLVCAGMMVLAPVAAVQLSTTETNACAAEGGCHIIAEKKLDELIENVYKAGFERGSISCGDRT